MYSRKTCPPTRHAAPPPPPPQYIQLRGLGPRLQPKKTKPGTNKLVNPYLFGEILDGLSAYFAPCQILTSAIKEVKWLLLVVSGLGASRTMNSFQKSFEGKVRQFLVRNVDPFNSLTSEPPQNRALHPQNSGLLVINSTLPHFLAC